MDFLLSFESLQLFKNILHARKDVNSFGRFLSQETDLIFECIDTFYKTQLSVKLHNMKLNNITQIHNTQQQIQTCIYLDSNATNCFFQLVSNNKSALVFTFDYNTPLYIKDPNTNVILVTLPWTMDLNESKYVSSFPQIAEHCINIPFLMLDIMTNFLNLSVCNAIVSIDLTQNMLTLHTFSEMGKIEITKKLNIKNNISFVSRFSIQHTKLLNTLNAKYCQLHFCLETKQLHIVFSLSDCIQVKLILCPYTY